MTTINELSKAVFSEYNSEDAPYQKHFSQTVLNGAAELLGISGETSSPVYSEPAFYAALKAACFEVDRCATAFWPDPFIKLVGTIRQKHSGAFVDYSDEYDADLDGWWGTWNPDPIEEQVQMVLSFGLLTQLVSDGVNLQFLDELVHDMCVYHRSGYDFDFHTGEVLAEEIARYDDWLDEGGFDPDGSHKPFDRLEIVRWIGPNEDDREQEAVAVFPLAMFGQPLIQSLIKAGLPQFIEWSEAA